MIHPSTPGAGDREGGDGPSASLRGAPRQNHRSQYQRQVEYRRLKKAGWIALRYYGNSGPYAWKLPGKTMWLTRAQALEQLARSAPEASSPKGPLPATPEVTP